MTVGVVLRRSDYGPDLFHINGAGTGHQDVQTREGVGRDLSNGLSSGTLNPGSTHRVPFGGTDRSGDTVLRDRKYFLSFE